MSQLTYQDIKKQAQEWEMKVYDLLTILSLLVERKEIPNNEFIQITGLPKTHAGRILKYLSAYLTPPSHLIKITEEGKRALQNVLDECNIQIANIVNLDEVIQSRPVAKREYDQFLATAETVKNRALYLKHKGELVGRKILFMGDDDHTSVAVASISFDCEITVLDIDIDILNSIKTLAQKYNLPITTQKYDARTDVPSELKAQFDVIFTDPPYTPPGISLFVNREIEFSKDASSSLYLCYGNSDRARERELEIQKIMAQKGLLIEEKLHNFNVYTGAESIGSNSSLYTLKRTPQTKVAHDFQKEIYTNETQVHSLNK